MGNVVTYSISGSSLELKTAEAKVGLKFAATEPAGLSKTRWVATGVNNGAGARRDVVIDTTITAIFAENYMVARPGSAPTTTMARSRATPRSSRYGPLATTRKLCNSPTGVDEQETQFLAAMQAATKYTIAGRSWSCATTPGRSRCPFGLPSEEAQQSPTTSASSTTPTRSRAPSGRWLRNSGWR